MYPVICWLQKIYCKVEQIFTIIQHEDTQIISILEDIQNQITVINTQIIQMNTEIINLQNSCNEYGQVINNINEIIEYNFNSSCDDKHFDPHCKPCDDDKKDK